MEFLQKRVGSNVITGEATENCSVTHHTVHASKTMHARRAKLVTLP